MQACLALYPPGISVAAAAPAPAPACWGCCSRMLGCLLLLRLLQYERGLPLVRHRSCLCMLGL